MGLGHTKRFFAFFKNSCGILYPLCGIICPVGGRKCLLVNIYIHLMKKEGL